VLSDYGVLRGHPAAARIETVDDNPHYQIRLVAGGIQYRVAVNVQSTDRSSLLYLADEAFAHPMLPRLGQLAPGYSPIPRIPDGLALDYLRTRLVSRTAMQQVPAHVAGPDNDLNEYLGKYVQRAIAEPSAELFAIGAPWGPEPRKADKVFGFRPGRGIHNIHMNQGNGPGHRFEDGIWQDGALFVHFPTQPRWVAIFLAFQSQSWRTDQHGHPATRAENVRP
jgi:uncharacterized protein YukJ